MSTACLLIILTAVPSSSKSRKRLQRSAVSQASAGMLLGVWSRRRTRYGRTISRYVKLVKIWYESRLICWRRPILNTNTCAAPRFLTTTWSTPSMRETRPPVNMSFGPKLLTLLWRLKWTKGNQYAFSISFCECSWLIFYTGSCWSLASFLTGSLTGFLTGFLSCRASSGSTVHQRHLGYGSEQLR